jgi:YVTN family beta-propeller protein
VAVSPDDSRVYVANNVDGSVSVINTSNNTVVATVTAGSGSLDVAVSPDGSRVYVANYFDSSVSVIESGPSVTAPAAPTSLNATPENGSASIAFTAGANGGAAITKYQYQLGSGSWTDAVGTTSPISISGLTNGTNYSIKLRPVNSAGNGAASDAVSVTPRTNPSAPTSLVATPGDSSASVAFTAGADGGSSITNYEYQLNGSGSWFAFSPAVTSGPVSIPVTNGVAYTVKLRAVNAAGSGAASSASASFTPATTPSAPTSLSADAGDGSVTIDFTAGSNGGAAIIKYQYSIDGGINWSDADAGTTSPVTISGLTNYIGHSFKLRAVNSAGAGAASVATGTVTPAAAGPSACSATALGRFKIQACWNLLTPAQGQVTLYRADVYESGTNTRRATCKGTSVDTSCVIARKAYLSPSTAYDVRVRARIKLAPRQVVWTLLSAPVQVTTLP